jgi:DNA-binding CsgD family transcriptional regulator
MQTQGFALEAGFEARRSGMAQGLAGLVGCIGEGDFAPAALAELNRCLPVGSWTVYRLRPEAAPRLHLAATLAQRHDCTADAWRCYTDGLYRGDTTFDAARRALHRSPAALTHLRRDEVQGDHRRAIYTHNRLSERVSLVQQQADAALLCVNLYRYDDQPPVGDGELGELLAAAPLLLACVSRHLALQARWAPADPLADLPRREREVCERLLRGMTHDGIAADLQLSATTVRTYRDRAFERLGIRYRQELFALALQAERGVSAAPH